MKTALFLDRDGTIIEDPGYLSKVEQIKFLPGVLEKIRLLKQKGLLIFIVTNQSGIGRGYFSENQLTLIHNGLTYMMEKAGAGVDKITYCPHAPADKCSCRKPSPKMVAELAEEFDVDLEKSFFLGDKLSDVLTGKNAGCRTVLILNNKPRAKLCTADSDWIEPDYVAATPDKALEWVLENL